MAAKKTKTKKKRKKKNSLVENINRRKRAGTSRPKARSTVSRDAYERMQEGWPRSSRAKAKA
jgi:hypothetical protein